jgi:hypothetical protein
VTVLSTAPARVAADFVIAEPRPRSDAWLRSTEAMQMAERVIQHLRAGHGKAAGQLRISV